MYCGKCGAQLPEGAVFCNNCGQKMSEEPQKSEQPIQQPTLQPQPQPQPQPTYEPRNVKPTPEGKPAKKKGGGKIIAILVAVVIVAGIAAGGYFVLTNPKIRLGSALSKGDVEKAYEIFSESMFPEDLSEKDIANLTAAAEKIGEDYSAGEITYEEATEKISLLRQFECDGISEAIASVSEDVETSHRIAGYLETADGYYQNADYESALEGYNTVLALEPENEAALQGVQNATDGIVKDLISQAEEKIGEESFTRATSLYNKALEYDPDNEAALKGLADVGKKQAESYIKQAENYIADGNYTEAFRMYDEALSSDPDNQEAVSGRKNAEAKYKESVVTEAKSLADSEKYDEAERTVMNSISNGISSDDEDLAETLDYIHDKRIEAMNETVYTAVDGGDWDKALELLDQYEAELPGDEDLAKTREDVEKKKPVTMFDNIVSSDRLDLNKDIVKDRWNGIYDGGVRIGSSSGNEGYVLYNLSKNFTEYYAKVFTPTYAENGQSMSIAIYLDNELTLLKENITEESEPFDLTVDVTGKTTMRIVVKNNGRWKNDFLYFCNSNFKKVEE